MSSLFSNFPMAPAAALGKAGRSEWIEQVSKTVTALFDVKRDALIRYLVFLGLEITEAEEITQETFLALFRHLQDGKPDHHLNAWLFKVAHNLGLKRRRRRGSMTTLHFGEPGEGAWEHADPAPSAEQRLLVQEQYHQVHAVMRALPESDRQCLRLRAEGLRYREIAEVLGVSLGQVALSLERSVQKFRRVTGAPR